MRDTWQDGLKHFERGNYYAARDIWRALLASEADSDTLIRINNSLGAVYSILYGAKEALPYFSEVLHIIERTNPGFPGRIKYLSNMSWVMTQLNRADEALRYGRAALNLVSLEDPYYSLHALNSYMMALTRFEMQDEAINHVSEIEQFVADAAKREGVPKIDVSRCYHFLGRLYHYANDYDTAVRYYEQAVAVYEMQTTVQELARLYLFQNRVEESIKFTEKLYQTLWNEALGMQKVDLADTLSLIGATAHFAGQTSLYNLCMEKAELYYGQKLRWRQWASVRDFQETLSSLEIACPPDALDWQQWQNCLEDLALVDGIESMFPTLYRWSEVANQLTVRLIRHFDFSFDTAWPIVRIAGRMVYLGLTTLASSEAEAKSLLLDAAAIPEVVAYGTRILESYPHTACYRDVVSSHRIQSPRGDSAESRYLSQCVGIAVQLVELIELHQLPYREAVERILQTRHQCYEPDVLAAFEKETVLG